MDVAELREELSLSRVWPTQFRRTSLSLERGRASLANDFAMITMITMTTMAHDDIVSVVGRCGGRRSSVGGPLSLASMALFCRTSPSLETAPISRVRGAPLAYGWR